MSDSDKQMDEVGVNTVAVTVDSDDDEDVIEFEEDVLEPSDMDHDPMDDPQTCLGFKLCCTKRAFRKVLGLTCVAIAAFMFSLVTLGVKTSIHGGMDFCGVLVFRGGVSWIINGCVMAFRRFPFMQTLGTKEKVPLLMLCGFFGAFTQLFAFYSVSVLSMADANVYMMTSPVFVFLLARVWLGDPVDFVDVIAAIVCITGVIFVSRPSAIFGCDSTDDCGLTQFCVPDGGCQNCGSDLDADKTLDTIITTENYTAYQICRGVEQLTTESNTSALYCDTSWGLETKFTTPANNDGNCHSECLNTADCGFFTSGYNNLKLECILYLGEVCNGTSLNSVDQLSNFNGQSTNPPLLFRMLGEIRESEANEKGIAILSGVLSAAFASVTYCSIRKIGHGIDGLVCVNYFSLISWICALIGTAWQGFPLPLHSEVWGAVIGMGVAGFLGQYLLTVGFQLEKPGPASVIRYCDVVFVFIWDAAFFSTTPGWNSYVGALLVILAAIGIVMNKARKQKLGIKQAKPLINFGDCACCCRPQKGDDGGGEEDASKSKAEERNPKSLLKTKSKAKTEAAH